MLAPAGMFSAEASPIGPGPSRNRERLLGRALASRLATEIVLRAGDDPHRPPALHFVSQRCEFLRGSGCIRDCRGALPQPHLRGRQGEEAHRDERHLRLRRAVFTARSAVSTAAARPPEDHCTRARQLSARACMPASPVRSAIASLSSASLCARSTSPVAVRLSARNSSRASDWCRPHALPTRTWSIRSPARAGRPTRGRAPLRSLRRQGSISPLRRARRGACGGAGLIVSSARQRSWRAATL